MEQIMISFHSSMLSTAQLLRNFLVTSQYTVHLFPTDGPGETKLCENASKCQVFVAFMNKDWCNSARCMLEFNIALAQNLKTKTPVIIPVLFEELSFYIEYSTIAGFLRTVVGTQASLMEPTVLGKWILTRIQDHRVYPANRLVIQAPSSSPSRRLPPEIVAFIKALRPTPPTDLEKLHLTTLQLVDELSQIDVNLGVLKWDVRPTLEASIPSVQMETALRALMDLIRKIKENRSSTILSTYKMLELQREMVETACNTVCMLEMDTDVTVADFIKERYTRAFWEKYIGKTIYTATWQQFVQALARDENAYFIREPNVENKLQEILLRLDPYQSGHIVCHRLQDFVGTDSLFVAIRNFLESKKAPPAPSHSQNLPVLLWIDGTPENNEHMIDYARSLKVNVITLRSPAEARRYLSANPTLLESNQVRIVTNNARSNEGTGLSMNSGEIVIRFVRGKKSQVPILVYCGDLAYAKYVGLFSECSATNQASVCQKFIEELVWPHV